MEIKYYGLPKEYVNFKHILVDNYIDFIKYIYSNRDSLLDLYVNNKGFICEDILNHTLSYTFDVCINGLVLDVSNMIDSNNSSNDICKVTVVIKDNEVNYIVNGIGGDNGEVIYVNEDELLKIKGSVGSKVKLDVLPSASMINLFNSKRNQLIISNEEKVLRVKNLLNQLSDTSNVISTESIEKKVEEVEELKEELIKKTEEINSHIDSYEFDDNKEGKAVVPFDVLFKEVDGHYEFHSKFLINNRVRNIKLSGIDFTNVKVSGIDLSLTDCVINPQTVYNKDLSNGNYIGVYFDFHSFEGVNITGSKFGCSELGDGSFYFNDIDKAIDNKSSGFSIDTVSTNKDVIEMLAKISSMSYEDLIK